MFSLVQQGAVLSRIVRVLRTFSSPSDPTQMPQFRKPSSGKCRWPLGTNTFFSPTRVSVFLAWKNRRLKSFWSTSTHTNTHKDLSVQLDDGRLSFLIGYPSLPGGKHVIERVPADACSAEKRQKEQWAEKLIMVSVIFRSAPHHFVWKLVGGCWVTHWLPSSWTSKHAEPTSPKKKVSTPWSLQELLYSDEWVRRPRMFVCVCVFVRISVCKSADQPSLCSRCYREGVWSVGCPAAFTPPAPVCESGHGWSCTITCSVTKPLFGLAGQNWGLALSVCVCVCAWPRW